MNPLLGVLFGHIFQRPIKVCRYLIVVLIATQFFTMSTGIPGLAAFVKGQWVTMEPIRTILAQVDCEKSFDGNNEFVAWFKNTGPTTVVLEGAILPAGQQPRASDWGDIGTLRPGQIGVEYGVAGNAERHEILGRIVGAVPDVVNVHVLQRAVGAPSAGIVVAR